MDRKLDVRVRGEDPPRYAKLIWRAYESESVFVVTVMITGTSLGVPGAIPPVSGAIGGGGLGELAIRYGYQRFQPDVMVITVVLLLILVQILQLIGDRLVIHFSHK